MDTPTPVRRTLRRVAPLKAAIVLGLMYAALGLVLMPLILLASFLGAHAHASSAPAGLPIAMGLGFAIFAPIFYGVAGFIGGLISAALYNLFAGWVGGIEFEVT